MSVLTTIQQMFPPPTFMQLPSVGVDISDSSLKYIQFVPDSKSGRTLNLTAWGDIDIPDGALKRGTVHEPKQLAEAIREMKDRTGLQNVRVSLPEERAYLFETEIRRGTPINEIRGLLEFKLEENVPLSPRDAFFDYDIIETDTASSALHVSVTAYARATVMSYYDACVTAGVVPLSFEVEAQAIARATTPQPDQGTHLIVDFGHTRSGIGIVHNGILMYTSTIDIGGQELSIALKSVVGDQPESEYTNIKNTIGLMAGAKDSAVRDALLPVMENISQEVSTRIDYWHGRSIQDDRRQIQDIILCGGSVNMKGLPGYFSKTLSIPAVRANVWQNAFSFDTYVPPIDQRHSYGYATAVGLALTPFTHLL